MDRKRVESLPNYGCATPRWPRRERQAEPERQGDPEPGPEERPLSLYERIWGRRR